MKDNPPENVNSGDNMGGDNVGTLGGGRKSRVEAPTFRGEYLEVVHRHLEDLGLLQLG